MTKEPKNDPVAAFYLALGASEDVARAMAESDRVLALHAEAVAADMWAQLDAEMMKGRE